MINRDKETIHLYCHYPSLWEEETPTQSRRDQAEHAANFALPAFPSISGTRSHRYRVPIQRHTPRTLRGDDEGLRVQRILPWKTHALCASFSGGRFHWLVNIFCQERFNIYRRCCVVESHFVFPFFRYSRYDCCTEVSCRPLSGCFRFAWSPGFPWLLGSRCSSCPVRGVAPNLRIQSLIREFTKAIACGVCLTFSPFLLEFISRLVALHSVH